MISTHILGNGKGPIPSAQEEKFTRFVRYSVRARRLPATCCQLTPAATAPP